MNRSRCLRHVAAAFVFGAGIVGAAFSASAQGMITEPMKIGVVLPVAAADAPDFQQAFVRGADQGAVLAEEEFSFNAEMLDMVFQIVRAPGGTPEEAVATAQRLVDEEGVYAIIGGYSDAEALALSEWAAEAHVPFVNVGSADDSLRNDNCQATTFHLEPSAAMYLDATAGWYVRAGFRSWLIVEDGTPASAAQHARLTEALTTRHFGVREVGTETIAPGASADQLPAAIQRTGADFVLLLQSPADQLTTMAALDAAGLDLQVTGFPYPETQSRAYFTAQQTAAPTIGTNNRVTSWEATLDAYGAREMNARYRGRFNEAMDPIAWSTYQAIKTLYEAAFFSGSLEADSVIAYMTNPGTVFDVYKGIGTSFRSWDHQLRQTLYLDKIADERVDNFDMALLVGELPAIYMPGTDPVERLDQIGDLEAQSTCRLQ